MSCGSRLYANRRSHRAPDSALAFKDPAAWARKLPATAPLALASLWRLPAALSRLSIMGTSARRSTRSLARAADGEAAAAAVDAATVELSAAAEPAEQPRKRPRRAAAAAAKLVVEADAAAEAAGSDAEGEEAAAPAAKGRSRATKLKAPGPTRELEAELWQQGYASVAGVDEAGRGPLAGGPAVVACLLVPGGMASAARCALLPRRCMPARRSLQLHSPSTPACRPSCGCCLRGARTRGDQRHRRQQGAACCTQHGMAVIRSSVAIHHQSYASHGCSGSCAV